MLRALCLLALLVPLDVEAQLEPQAIGFVFSDSLVFPFAYYDGQEWTATSAEELAPYGPLSWSTINLKTGERSSMESGVRHSDWIEFRAPVNKLGGYTTTGGVGLPITWDEEPSLHALAFTPATPRGARFVEADTVIGSRLLRETIRSEGWKGDVRTLACSRPDLPGDSVPTYCSAWGRYYVPDTTGRTDRRERVYMHEHTMRAEVWFWGEHQAASRFSFVSGGGKMLGDEFRPLYYLDLPEPVVIGDASMWEGSYGYIATLPIPSDDAAFFPTPVVEKGWD